MDRHDGKELIDGPAVGERLEDGEVTEVAVDERGIEVLEDILEIVAVPFDVAVDDVQRREVNTLGNGALAQREDAGVEQLVRALLVEGEIVVDLADAPARHVFSRRVLVIGDHLVE